MTSIHIKNASVATMDKSKHIYPHGEVLIEDDRIVEVGKKVKPPRNRAVLRRAQPPSEAGQSRFFTHDNLKIDFARAEEWRSETPVSLSATEYRLLLQFAHHVGKIMTSEDLLTSVWGPEYRTDKEILWVSIAPLRQKLEDDAHSPKHIVTRSGLGYLMPPIEESSFQEADVVGKSILVLDENIASRNFLANILREKQYKVIAADSGKEALIAAWRDGPDLILFDPVLSDIQDEEFISKLRHNPRTNGTPLIAISSDPGRLEMQPLLADVCGQVADVLGYPNVEILLVEGEQLVMRASKGAEKAVGLRIPLESGIVGRVARSDPAAFVPDVLVDPDYVLAIASTRSEIVVPLRKGNLVIGVHNVESPIPFGLTEDDARLLSLIADQVSVAIENAALYDRLRRYSTELEQTVAERTARLAEALERATESDRLKTQFVADFSSRYRAGMAIRPLASSVTLLAPRNISGC